MILALDILQVAVLATISVIKFYQAHLISNLQDLQLKVNALTVRSRPLPNRRLACDRKAP